MRYKVNPLSGQELRRMARKRYAALGRAGDLASLTAADVQRLLEELAVSKIELELQNAHLQDTRAQLELALTQSVELFDFAAVALFSCDAGGVVAKANFAGAQLLGTERSRLAGQPFAPFFVAAQRSRIQARLAQPSALADDPVLELTLQDSGLPTQQVQMSVSHPSQGSHCIITLTDVSERKLLQEHLLAQRQQLQALTEIACDGYWIWDVGSTQVRYSAQLTQLYGYSVAEFGHTLDAWRARIHPDDQSAFLRASQECLAGRGKRFACEQRVQCRDGSWKWILCGGVVLPADPDGSVRQLAGIHTDITDRKHKADSLRALRDRQQAVFDALGNRIALLNAEGTIVDTNAAWKEFEQLGAAGPPCVQDGVGRHFAAVLGPLAGGDAYEAQRAMRGSAEVLSGARASYRQAYTHGSGAAQRCFLLEALPVRDGTVRALLTQQEITPFRRELAGAQELQFLHMAEQEFQRARRYGNPLVVLAMAWTASMAFDGDPRGALMDALQQELQRLLQQGLRTSDLLGQTGRNTFAALLPDTSLEGGEAQGQRLLEQLLNQPISVFGMSVPVSLSLGVCRLGEDASLAALLGRAEIALRSVAQCRGYGVAADPAGGPCLW